MTLEATLSSEILLMAKATASQCLQIAVLKPSVKAVAYDY